MWICYSTNLWEHLSWRNQSHWSIESCSFDWFNLTRDYELANLAMCWPSWYFKKYFLLFQLIFLRKIKIITLRIPPFYFRANCKFRFKHGLKMRTNLVFFLEMSMILIDSTWFAKLWDIYVIIPNIEANVTSYNWIVFLKWILQN